MPPLILDMDPGVDDALALVWSLAWAECDVCAVMTVSGNVDVDLGTSNALRLLALMGRPDIPVYRGEGRPLEGEPIRAAHIHGGTGLGEAQLPSSTGTADSGASAALSDRLTSEPDLYSIVAVGPLTNLATAELNDPGVLAKASEVFVMGGAIHVPGNVTPTGEFNLVSDPRAASIVFESNATIRLVPLDVTRKMRVTQAEMKEGLTDCPAEIRGFLMAATSTPMKIGREKYGYDGMYLHDPLTAMLSVEPMWAEWETFHIQIETQGEFTHGQIVVDERSQPVHQGKPIQVAMDIDRTKLLDAFFQPIRSWRGAKK